METLKYSLIGPIFTQRYRLIQLFARLESIYFPSSSRDRNVSNSKR